MTSHSDEAYLKVGELSDWLNVSRSTIYRWVEQNHFPRPVVMGIGTPEGHSSVSRWKRSDILAWLDTRQEVEKDAD